MPNADRAAVAREEVLRFLDEAHREGTPELFRLTGAQYSYLSGRAQATYPAAPEAVTVEVDGVPVSLTREPQRVVCLRGGVVPIALYAPESLAMFDRIASDARVIQERDARIAELEQLLRDQPLLLYDSAWQAIDRMGDAVGALTGPGSNCHTTAHRVCETIETLKDERDAALRALEASKGEAGATVAASEPLASESPAATSPSPAPIPLGATVVVEGDKDSPYTLTILGWADKHGYAWENDNSLARAPMLAAIYRARHPVATRETVERVAEAVAEHEGASMAQFGPVLRADYMSLARAALTAMGVTIQEDGA